MSVDRARLEQDARGIMDVYDNPSVQHVAAVVLAVLEDPSVLVPDGFALVRKPELLGKGVPQR